MDEKNLEIVSGNGDEVEFSEVRDHLKPAKPKTNQEKPKNIIIPVEKTNNSEEKNDDNTKKDNSEEQKQDNN